MSDRDQPDASGAIEPGKKGFLHQQVTGGPPESFKQTMERIDRKLTLKQQKERTAAYQAAETKKMAKEASKAVGRMASNIQQEAAENAEHKAAIAEECKLKWSSTSDPAEREMLAKECKEAIEAKKQAYNKAANAEAASEKALDSAGANEGKILGT